MVTSNNDDVAMPVFRGNRLLVSGLMFADTQPASSKPKSKTAKTTKAKAAEKKSASKPEAEYEGMPPALAKHLERLHRAMPGHPFVPKFAGGGEFQPGTDS